MRRSVRYGRLALSAVVALPVVLTVTACSANSAPQPISSSALASRAAAQSSPVSNRGVQAARASTTSSTPGRPNVVMFIVDDLGFGDTAMAHPTSASRRKSSPVMDQMARTGTSFDQGTASPNCAPTRAALLTGTASTNPTNNIYAVKGLGRYTGDAMTVVPAQGLPGSHQVALAQSATTWAEVLRDSGYRTGTVGKFHVTQTANQIRSWHGFDVNAGGDSSGYARAYRAKKHGKKRTFGRGVSGSLNRFAGDYTKRYVNRNIRPFSSGVSKAALNKTIGQRKNVSDAVADASQLFVKRAAASGKPFALNVGSYAVHAPVTRAQTRPDLAAKYRADRGTRKQSRRRSYDAILEGTDQALGRLLTTLDTTPDPRHQGHTLADNTIVFVTSDNGGVRRYSALQDGLRNEKSSLWDGGLRVPWLVWSKNKRLVPSGELRHQSINATDFYPTLLQATGVSVPNPQVIDGVSWWPALRDPSVDLLAGKDLARHARVLHFPGYVDFTGARPSTIVRTSRWKLFYRYETGTWQLFDLANDRGETTDVAAANPAVVRQLGEQMVNWLDRHNAPLVHLRGYRLERAHFTGTKYVNGVAQRVADATVTVLPGEPVPLLLPDNDAELAHSGLPPKNYGKTTIRNHWQVFR